MTTAPCPTCGTTLTAALAAAVANPLADESCPSRRDRRRISLLPADMIPEEKLIEMRLRLAAGYLMPPTETAEQLNARVDADYRRNHPEFQPSDIKVGERVTMGGSRGIVEATYENGATISVRWDGMSSGSQNVASGHVRRIPTPMPVNR